MHIQHVMQQLTMREFTWLCDNVDTYVGQPNIKFTVLEIERQDNALRVKVDTKNGWVFWTVVVRNEEHIVMHKCTQRAA